MKPVLFVTGHAPRDRIGAFARLHELENVEFALFGGRSKHGVSSSEGSSATAVRSTFDDTAESTSESTQELGFPYRHVRQTEVAKLSASGKYRAVVCGTGGRAALPSAWVGARRAGVPLVLWASLWAHPRSAAHALSYPALRRLYGSADAVVTYGEHVSAYVRAHGGRNVFVAPQAVDNAFWSSSDVSTPQTPSWPAAATLRFLFVGRSAREKGLGVLVKAWNSSGLKAPSAALVLVGVGSNPPWIPAGGAVSSSSGNAVGPNIVGLEPVGAHELRNFYGSADVLVLASIRTRTFREPWGLVVNEAMNQRLPVIVSDEVGAAAGGLVRNEHNGLVVPAGDSVALGGALKRMAEDAELRRRFGEAGANDVGAYTYDAWAHGFSRALHSVGVGRGRW